MSRIDRVKELIKREVASILQDQIDDPRLDLVTVTRVEVSKDLKFARVFYALPENGNGAEAVAKALKSAGAFFRAGLAKRVSMKFMPRVSFAEDIREKKKNIVEDIFRKIKEERGKGHRA